jgi:hypothetical protein
MPPDGDKPLVILIQPDTPGTHAIHGELDVVKTLKLAPAPGGQL